MSGLAPLRVWVGAGVGAVADRLDAAGEVQPAGQASWFGAAPAAVLSVSDAERRLPDAALKAALETLADQWVLELDRVALLLVFSASFATAHTRRLVACVEDPTRRVRPRDSTDMETSESIRWTLEQLDRGVPEATVIVASPYDPALVDLLAPSDGAMLVLRYELWGEDPRQTDVLLGYQQAVNESRLVEVGR